MASWLIQARQSSPAWVGKREKEGKHCSAAPGVFPEPKQVKLRIWGILLIFQPVLHRWGDLGSKETG